ncbi:MAG: bi-domain-containing oxidoreductase [Bacteroidota bacterium]|nr:bi-domain-containing oxidoreductase [Bacteroidota bacterium]
MKQLIQNFKTGELYVDELPIPSLQEGMVLVHNAYSLISAGTERGTVKTAQASLLGKAKARPDLVAQVLQNLKKEGLKATLEKVRTKLDSLKALGYSTAGIVVASADTNGFFKPGDRVACGGQDYASHAEFISVPQNLVVKIPDNVNFEEAAFTTLGAIALQGVRQAEPRLGECICVIGLGLLGQITCQLLRANGCKVVGIDVSSAMLDQALQSGANMAMLRNDTNLLTACENYTQGHGFDSVIITAGSPDNDPVVLATELLRKKGRLVVVGAVKMDIPRDPYFYRKELELRISCSYGPGRYDHSYEDQGHDYPFAYVRFTEQRNMETFLGLIASEAINVKPLITQVFDISQATEAYDIILGKIKSPHIGILLKYDQDSIQDKNVIEVNHSPAKDINVGFIGAGSFAQSYLIPHVKKNEGSLDTVVTATGISCKNVAQKFGFNKATTDAKEIFGNTVLNTIFIATQHNTHAQYVIEALKAGKNIFVEKPLALTFDELHNVIAAYEEAKSPRLMVGFNRRFAPVSQEIKKHFKGIGEPLVMNFRINAGFLPKEHWTQTEAGGGRIMGEVCHFIDLMQFFVEAKPVKIYAECINTTNIQIKAEDNLSVIVKFEDGSVGNLLYLANGDKSMPKEYIEIFGGKSIGVIQDFKSGSIYKNGKQTKLSMFGKGHAEEVSAFLNSIRKGLPSPINFLSLCHTTLVTLKIEDSLKTGLPQFIE